MGTATQTGIYTLREKNQNKRKHLKWIRVWRISVLIDVKRQESFTTEFIEKKKNNKNRRFVIEFCRGVGREPVVCGRSLGFRRNETADPMIMYS